MKKRLFLVMLFIFTINLLNVNAVDKCMTKPASELTSLTDLMKAVKKNCENKLDLFCVYGDPESKIKEEQEHLMFFYRRKKSIYPNDVFAASDIEYLYEDSSLPYYFGGPNAPKELSGGHYFASAKNFATEKKIDKLKQCPDRVYYMCLVENFGENTKYKNIRGCYFDLNEFTVSDVLSSPQNSYLDKKELLSLGTISGYWGKNPKESVIEVEQNLITRYVSLSRDVNIYINKEEISDSESNIKAIINKKNINITNLDKYQNEFKKESENYPKFLIVTEDDKYKFVDTLEDKSGNKIEYKELYVYVKYLNEVYGLGKQEFYNYCEDLFGESLLSLLNNNVIKVIGIGVPILLVLLSVFDFGKVIIVDDKEGMQKAFKRFGKRVIAAILVFLTPTIIILISNIIGANSNIDACVKQINEMSESK